MHIEISHLSSVLSSKYISPEKHHYLYLKIWKFKVATIEIVISNNELAGVILNPKYKECILEAKISTN